MRRIPLALAALLLAGCGYIGGPLPPLANVPAPIADLAAVERGGAIIVQFTPPAMTTERMPVPQPLTLDVRAGAAANPFDPAQWAAGAVKQPERTAPKGIARFDIPAGPWVGREIVIGARSIGANGKASDWSNFARFPVVPAPAQPTEVHGESTAGGLRLSWRGAGAHFRVLRKTAADSQFAVVAPDIARTEWVDPAATPGTEYTYIVQAFVPLGENREAQSDLSPELNITPEPPLPATPAGLLAVASPNSIELSWDGNSDSVTTGYRVYRATGSGGFEKIADVSAVPTYSDRVVEHGKTYRYALAALDRGGRESPRTAPVEVAFP